MTAYYNEIDPYAAQWLRNLIDAGHIAPGIVDTRSIEDITPNELRDFTQCHFFAGIGVWSHALRRAGWEDDRPVWTGSCPCQPFSSAGAGAGFADERHLWPAFFHLIEQCKPAVVFGEQVASRDANPWIDLVQTDLEAVGYGVGAVPFPSAGVGAPHIRDRLYWMADATGTGPQRGQPSWKRTDAQRSAAERGGAIGWMADGDQHGRLALPVDRGHNAEHHLEPCGESGGLADPTSGRYITSLARSDKRGFSPSDGGHQGRSTTGPVNGLWSATDWLLCRDGKWRPVEPGTFPLAHGAPARVGCLRAYGNAINAEAARVFVESCNL